MNNSFRDPKAYPAVQVPIEFKIALHGNDLPQKQFCMAK
ncbi:hypothetical protein SAMCFNEI73_pC1582 (plasmid) [Sinorhizobium americanum]|uniref:Uncharacterized protein n=1 Tax=Sinorhizobium americanum TaxID=194963 RepID=A0A1L3LZ18_9HYPH|nr:hypothetical protein SAMCCGM7_pA0255 [Sinorhizobium americanum CCGM7]APG95286.1 hypothetical protein SAMCFNEI73_pC1582 [Sinorhizobium americanum]